MNILLLSQHYPPDLGAVAFRMEAIVNELIANNHKVYVLAATPNRYKDYRINDKYISKTDEIRIIMKNSSRSIFSRIRGFFEFYRKSLKQKKYYKDKKIDIVISTTPYVLEGLAGQKIAKYLNAKHLLDVRDLWPDTPIALGKIKKHGIIAFALRVVEKKLYKKTDHIIITSPGYEQHIKNIVKNKPINVILNGIDDEFEDGFNKYCSENNNKKTNNVKTILYAGNIGIAQNLLTLIKAAIKLKDDKIKFQLIGSGTQLKEINDMIKQYNLENVEIIPPVKREELFSYYCDADAVYLQLFSSEYFNQVVPSKIFEYLLIQKPIIYGLNGVSAEILNEYDETYYVVPDNSDNLAEKIKKMDISKTVNRDITSLKRNIQIKKIIEILKNMMEEE
jgi:glycosyltransferase involved in cell wall biosynthesis